METICMKYQILFSGEKKFSNGDNLHEMSILFSGEKIRNVKSYWNVKSFFWEKNKKNITNLSSAESAKRVIKIDKVYT